MLWANMRKGFFEVFRENEDGSLTPLGTIKIGGVMLGAGSVKFTRGVIFAGINIFDFYGRDIEAKEENGMVEIEGFYQ